MDEAFLICIDVPTHCYGRRRYSSSCGEVNLSSSASPSFSSPPFFSRIPEFYRRFAVGYMSVTCRVEPEQSKLPIHIHNTKAHDRHARHDRQDGSVAVRAQAGQAGARMAGLDSCTLSSQ